MFPSHCEGCADELPQVRDPEAHRYQQVEMPPIKPHTKEWRCHEVACPKCRHKTRATYDAAKIPASPFGPRLMAMIAFLTGVYHVSRRKTVVLLWELLGVRISLGALSAVEARVSDAIAPAVEDAWRRVSAGAVKHTDGTSWLQAGATRALWTIATKAATVFKILADSSKATLQPLYGSLRGILVSDRAKALNFWAMDHRQICWAHLLRKFVSFSERAGPAAAMGHELLDYTGILFEYWHDYRDGKLPRATFLAWMAALGRRWRPCSPAASPPASTASRGRAPTSWSTSRRSGRSSRTTTSSPRIITPKGRSVPSCSGASAPTVRRATGAISSPSA